MKDGSISWNGLIAAPGAPGTPFGELPAAHFIYQRIRVADGKVSGLDEHLSAVARAFWNIHRTRPEFDAGTIERQVAALLRENRYPAAADATAMLYFFPSEGGADLLIVCGRPLFDRGYAVSSMRPVAASYPYELICEGFPTNFMLSAARFHDALAFGRGATKSVRSRGGMLLECGDAPLFGICGKTLFTAPLCDGAADSAERRLVLRAASKTGLDFLEEAVPLGELGRFDELFYADAAGITPLSECDGSKFMCLLTMRIADAIRAMGDGR